MENIINHIIENLKEELIEFFNNPKITLASAEKELGKMVLKYVRTLIQEYIKAKDEEIRLDKAGRKIHKLTIVRKNDKRTVLTSLGQIEYNRTYYKNGTDGGYVYVVDKLLEIDPRKRITDTICNDLVNKAVSESYFKASMEVTDGLVSRH